MVNSHEAAGLQVDAVSIVYPGGVRAVDDVSLTVAPGEVLALVGASGSGKSSLLRAIAGLEPLTAGTIRLDDTDLAGLPVHRRGVGMVFQDGQLFDHLDVTGNVAYGLRSGPREDRPDRTARAGRVAELLDLVGLTDLADRPVTTLSGGQAQRIALARALAPGPRVLLLDEPLSALDRVLRERLAVDLAAILRAAGTTAVHVTHDLDEAATVADRIAVLSDGRLLQVDSPHGLWAAPADREVAELLGYGPVLPASALGMGEGEVALAPGALLVDDDAPGGGQEAGDDDAAPGAGPLPGDDDDAPGAGQEAGDDDAAPGAGQEAGDDDAAPRPAPGDVVAVLSARSTGVRHVRGRTWVDVVLASGERGRALVPGGDPPPEVRRVAVLRPGVVRLGHGEPRESDAG